MPDLKELKRIKKKYGEDFMKLCRDLFPTILEQEGRLEEILDKSFAGNSRTLYEDIVNAGQEENFKNFIYHKIDTEDSDKKFVVEKTPYELLDEAGYDLYECLTEEQIQEFKKYYKYEEELCTFRGGRLDRCIVFFAVKKNVEEIKRENFKNPEREDEYGTSVMGIQFNRYGLCTVSIKNRYNHTVNNPDATYGNDLNRIVPGLTQSFSDLLKKEYNLELNNANVENLNIPNYVVASDGRYYRYNMEINGNYYCPGNIIITPYERRKLKESESQILIDYFVLDLKNKTVILLDPEIIDSFIDGLKDLKDAQIKIEKSKKNENKTKIITIQKKGEEPIIIEIDYNSQIIRYENPELQIIRESFLSFNKGLTDLNLPNLQKVEDRFLYSNRNLNALNLPNLQEIGDYFLYHNKKLINLSLPKLKQVGRSFLCNNCMLNTLDLPNLEYADSMFLSENRMLSDLNLVNLKKTGDNFLSMNQEMSSLNLPNLEQVEDYFLYANRKLNSFNLPNLKIVGSRFLYRNEELTNLNLPKLEQVGNYFLYGNQKLNNLNLPNLKIVGSTFLYRNKELTNLNLPKLEQIGDYFLYGNRKLNNLDFPNLKEVGNYVNTTLINGNKINSDNIALLDKNNEVTESEFNLVKSMMNKLKGFFKNRFKNNR